MIRQWLLFDPQSSLKWPVFYGAKMRIAYWIVTVLAGVGLFLGGLGDLAGAPQVIDGLTHMGYPRYFATILGFWKVCGVLALLLPGLTRLKEWAYAGFFFVLSGAITSHIVAEGTAANAIPAMVLLTLVLLSYVLRPEQRTLAPSGT
ncbi:MAG: putative membrane protein YphA (DoxX/SURF4 family) [Myxococcota bacterium]